MSDTKPFTTTLFLTNADALDRVVRSAGAWSADSPCAGWSAADVLAHVVDTERDFLTAHGVALRARSTGDPGEVWADHLADLRSVLSDPATGEKAYDGWFGPTTVGDSLARFYGFDLLVHRWDLARAWSRDEPFTDDELDQLDAAIESFGPALYSEGVCAPALEAPPGADRQATLLARLGRQG